MLSGLIWGEGGRWGVVRPNLGGREEVGVLSGLIWGEGGRWGVVRPNLGGRGEVGCCQAYFRPT